MKLFLLKCAWCKKKLYRSKGRLNEAKKFDWKTYCSLKCQGKSRIKQKIFRCSNPKCTKTFWRTPSNIRSSKLYCSLSCAAYVNNLKFPKRKREIKKDKCRYCGKDFIIKEMGQVYCSRNCKDGAQIIGREKICKFIRRFYKQNDRIPLKRECKHYNAAQDRFGSWNKAIKAAGFEPNPVKFSKKFLAKDGHICDSFAEKIIDDWLASNNIEHQRNIPYPNSSYTADFQVRGKFIEFFGLSGELEEYDKNVKLKEKLAEKYKLKLIGIYPKDLFPINYLSKIIRIKKG